MNKLITKFNKKEDGFTLIELLVVILILGILIAVAVPQFLGQQERAGNTTAQVDIRTAYQAASGVRAGNDGIFPTNTALRAGMVASEPGLDSKLVEVASVSAAPTNLQVPASGRIGWGVDGSGASANGVFYAKASNGNIYCVSTKTGGSVRTVLAPTATPAVNSTVAATCG